MIANAAKVEARTGALAAKGLIDRLVKRDCVGSLSFGSGHMRGGIPDLQQPVEAEKPSGSNRSSSSHHPKRIPSFGGQVIVPSSKPRSSEPKADDGSEDSSSEDEDGLSVAELACLPKDAKLADAAHPPAYHEKASDHQQRGSLVPSVASTIRPKNILTTRISTSGPSSNSLSDEKAGVRTPSTPPAYVSKGAESDTENLPIALASPTTHEKSLGVDRPAENQILKTQTFLSSTLDNGGIPSNIGTIKTILSDASPQKNRQNKSSSREALNSPGLITTSLPEEVVDLIQSSKAVSQPSHLGGVLKSADHAQSDQTNVSEDVSEPLNPHDPRTSAVDPNQAANQDLKAQNLSKVVIEESHEPTMQVLLADSTPKAPELGPHRFTLFKPNWLTFLFLKSPSPGDPDYQRPICKACAKKIGIRKTFLECDDCGMKCHNKCSDSPTLPYCVSHSV
eukprot:GHVT01027587.1.p1 GENE.GHVT01027587.1~~GHVT01027587.1.p1  ORF type:complete len:463 (+),score=33.60 GHVT01027587.1:38-1390(+)